VFLLCAGTCSPGFYLLDQTCEACPAGSYCAGGTAPPVACGPGLKHIIATAQEAEQFGKLLLWLVIQLSFTHNLQNDCFSCNGSIQCQWWILVDTLHCAAVFCIVFY
jgi:hypothetical protein